ncbi:uncharacterized protein LOC143561332 [Bidens hawaiensis]|uniref:uncharacterized protein LOC143561332 n=1 Tax=Bidens hawaiensis TaxID=980011 RepID=UPI00404B235C
MTNIRAYNSAFFMTSFGAKVDNSINQGSGPYVFKISGQIHHWLGSLCPPPNQRPRFLQMYIYDTDNEISNRLHAFTDDTQCRLNADTIVALSNILGHCNELVKLFRTARDVISSIDTPSFSVCLYVSDRNRSYNRPSIGTLGAIISDDDATCHQYDIVVRHKDDKVQIISKLHRLYMSLQYPLLFPYGDSGWSPKLCLRLPVGTREKRLTVNMLDYIRNNQNLFRSELLQGIHDAVQRGDTEARDVGKRTFLPSSFTGGPRYMYKNYQDALAICRVHDIYTIELQKRGLPHCHLLLWVTHAYKIRDESDVDRYNSAQLPDPSIDPHLYQIVTDLMIHGPCGLLKPTSPCMSSGTCTKSFPKAYQETTSIDDNGYVHYKRPSDGPTIVKAGVKVDNRFVVPYNRTLSLHFVAHINVEYCGWSMLIKYLFKYISNGADRVHYTITSTQCPTDISQKQLSRLNEIQNFLDGRFICPHEASWRIFNFRIHERNPAVQSLAVHLQNMQNITFKDTDLLHNVSSNTFNSRTTLTAWLHNNKYDNSGHYLRYIDYVT